MSGHRWMSGAYVDEWAQVDERMSGAQMDEWGTGG